LTARSKALGFEGCLYLAGSDDSFFLIFVLLNVIESKEVPCFFDLGLFFCCNLVLFSEL